MRFRCTGTNINRPRRVIIGRVYEKVKPISEWRQEDDHDNLLIYLPGFRKVFIKVTTEGRNIIRIRGECLVAGNKWNWFLEDFKVPQNCKRSGIRAKFDGGILIITMRKKITDSSSTTTTPYLEESMKTVEQATDSEKHSSLTSNAILPPQPPVAKSDSTKPDDHGKTDQKPLDLTEEKEPLTEKIKKTKMDSDSKEMNRSEGYKRVVNRLAIGGLKERMVVNMVAVLVLVVAALRVYLFMFPTPLEPQAKKIN